MDRTASSEGAVSESPASGVTWIAPSNNGGHPITGYKVTSKPGGKTCATKGAKSCKVTGLTNGKPYSFTVVAVNLLGAGPASSPPASATPVGPPGAPRNVKATRGSSQASVSWAAPISDGGQPITKYVVTSRPGAKSCQTTGALTCTVTGLTNGKAYRFSVKATNSVGTGPASALSGPVTPLGAATH